MSKSKGITMLPSVILVVFGLSSCFAQHSGAYSSPQYAKKMYPIKPTFDPTGNGLLPKEKPPIPYKSGLQNRNYYQSQSQENISNEVNAVDGRNETLGRSSFLSSASSFLSGRGGQMVTEIAKEFIARSTGGSSQVLSLNLTNLVILVVLKALILAAGFFGAGAWKGGHGYGRSIDDNKNADYISEEEVLLYLSYLLGQQTDDYSCLQLMSCQRPAQAQMYTSGAELLLQGARLMSGTSIDISKYSSIAEMAREAAARGEGGMPCDQRYKCYTNN